MATIADYVVIRDTSDTININVEKPYYFSLPSSVETSGGSKRPIIAYMYDPSSDANNLSLEVRINGTYIGGNSNINSGLVRAKWEVFSGDILDTVGDNVVGFRVEGDRGNLRISDVFLLFQRSGFD